MFICVDAAQIFVFFLLLTCPVMQVPHTACRISFLYMATIKSRIKTATLMCFEWPSRTGLNASPWLPGNRWSLGKHVHSVSSWQVGCGRCWLLLGLNVVSKQIATVADSLCGSTQTLPKYLLSGRKTVKNTRHSRN